MLSGVFGYVEFISDVILVIKHLFQELAEIQYGCRTRTRH